MSGLPEVSGIVEVVERRFGFHLHDAQVVDHGVDVESLGELNSAAGAEFDFVDAENSSGRLTYRARLVHTVVVIVADNVHAVHGEIGRTGGRIPVVVGAAIVPLEHGVRGEKVAGGLECFSGWGWCWGCSCV